ncbi:phage integrase SAM-like domain-containing protein [uncultured Flavobacterium sp.]|uniref:phage integrase SAM-like domain-containing protein n=1 Tax=uncultured Flavobacterium sp. TaxID=165435 RepID=UPI0025EE8C81|nr:phage integrase SAM-like domain-containing protein [uncultured Flavobacterium sp.]
MASINLLLQSKKNPAVIYIRLRDGRTVDIKAKTNFHINPVNWDKDGQRPIKKLLKDISFANLDTDLSDLKMRLLKEYNVSKGLKEINIQWLNDFINPPSPKSKYPDRLIDYIDVFIAYREIDVKKATISKCYVIKHLLERYERSTATILYIRDINTAFKINFEKYCIDMGYAPNTIARNIRFIKTFCRHAKSNGVETHFQLDSIKVKYYKVDNIYLNLLELQKIEKLQSNELSEGLENAKDWLLISCYCGQRISDFLRFDKSMIRFEKNNAGELKPLIEFTQVKTGKLMTVPLDFKIMEILKKYDGNFPRKIADQKYNEYIKKVCKIAKINDEITGLKFNPDTKKKEERICQKWELVSSHIGRRSFATNKYGVIPTSFLMYITGHTTEAMFLKYIGKSNKDIAMHLSDYF